MTDQRPPQLGDWTVSQDTETVQTSIRTNSIDSINQLNVLDWAIADFKNGGEEPYIYVPNRVYALDTAILKPTLEGLMPIPENLDGNCYFETESRITVSNPYQTGYYVCSHVCPLRWPPTSCPYFNPTRKETSSRCRYFSAGKMVPLTVGIRGKAANIDINIRASSAFEYLDIRITDWPRSHTRVGGITIDEDDAMGWPAGQSPGEDFVYKALGNNVFRIWAWPGGGRNGNWGPAGTDAKIRVHFTIMGGPGTETLFSGSFPGVSRTVEVSYVGAGRRGNHR